MRLTTAAVAGPSDVRLQLASGARAEAVLAHVHAVTARRTIEIARGDARVVEQNRTRQEAVLVQADAN